MANDIAIKPSLWAHSGEVSLRIPDARRHATLRSIPWDTPAMNANPSDLPLPRLAKHDDDRGDTGTMRIPGTEFPMLELVPLQPSHAGLLHAWVSDPKARDWLDFGGGRQEISKRELFLMVTSARNHARLYRLPGTQAPLGLICLNDATNLMGTAQAWVIRGVYAHAPLNVTASACILAVATGFLDLGRHVIGSWVVANNYLSIAMHQKIGCTRSGVARQAHRVHGRCHDRLLFDITLEEFARRYPDVPSESGRTARSAGLVEA